MQPLLDRRISFLALCVAALPQVDAVEPPPAAGRLDEYLRQHSLAGMVSLVADRERVLEVRVAGWADLESCRPLDEDALFFIGSQTKPMTAALLMMLVDQGAVALDAPVERYLPEFHGQQLAAERAPDHVLLRPPAHPIRVLELLNHTSGLPFRSTLEQPTLDGLPLRDAVRSYATSALEFEPGSDYLYSNAGFNTLGRIVELLGDRPYEELMRERLFEPLGMRDTTFFPDAAQLERLARCYGPGADGELVRQTLRSLSEPLDGPGRHAVPAIGVFSTARDVARFCQMFLGGGELDGRRYLSAEAVRRMTNRQTSGDMASSGFGWYVGDAGFGHCGLYRTQMFVNLETERVYVLMAQQDRFANAEGARRLETFRARDPVRRR